jgi:mono/diheme cytochrome c family protein
MSRRTVTILFVAIFIGLLAVACNVNPQPAGLTPMPSLPPAATLTLAPAIQGGSTSSAPGGGATGTGNAAAGVAIFERNCTSCHGVNAEGNIGPTLRNDAFIKNGDAPVIDTISTGRPGTVMPAWLMSQGGPLTSSQILDVVAFLKTLQNVPIIPKPTPGPEEATETPLPPGPKPTLEPAKPSNPGNPGQAVSLTGNADRGKGLFGSSCAQCHGPQGALGVPNPGTEDGSVPPLNPIDPTIANADVKVFAQNVDLFIEHGSVPDGDAPAILMPNFGDGKIITPQDIADIIAYVIQLNKP